MKKYILYILLLIISSAKAQKAHLTLEQLETKVENGYIHVSFTISKTRNTVKSCHCLRIYPAIVNKTKQKKLPSVVIKGRQWRKRSLQKRLLAKVAEKEKHTFFGKEEDILHYKARIPYKEWMAVCQLRIQTEEEGCSKTYPRQEQTYSITCSFKTEITPYGLDIPPIIAPERELMRRYTFVSPTGEKRPDKPRIVIRFKVNESSIDPELNDNREVLNVIDSAITGLKQIDRCTIDNISIEGYASPEGNSLYNQQLAQKRAKALRDYIANKHHIESNNFTIYQRGANYKELRRLIASSSLKYKNEILRIIDRNPVEKREQALQSLHGGRAYIVLLDQYYPQLRNACYIRIFYKAAPDPVLTEINRGIERLNRGDYTDAFDLLQQYKEDPRSFFPLGICHLFRGEKEEALKFLMKAEAAGIPEAGKYIRQIEEQNPS